MPLATADIVLELGLERLSARISVPTEPILPCDILPVAQAILHKIIASAEETLASQGKRVSCKAGCGACCRQLVPITTTEARGLVALVDNLPEPRRTEIRERFHQAREVFRSEKMYDSLLNHDDWAPDDVQKLGIAYFRFGVPCPFLENESCSIHPDRPLTCREYLVTSPAENCASPGEKPIDLVPLGAKVWPAIARFDAIKPGSKFIPWVPLTLIFDWAEKATDVPVPTPGTQLIEQLFRNLTGKPLPHDPVVPFA